MRISWRRAFGTVVVGNDKGMGRWAGEIRKGKSGLGPDRSSMRVEGIRRVPAPTIYKAPIPHWLSISEAGFVLRASRVRFEYYSHALLGRIKSHAFVCFVCLYDRAHYEVLTSRASGLTSTKFLRYIISNSVLHEDRLARATTTSAPRWWGGFIP